MRVLASRLLEDCLDLTRIKEMELDEPLDEATMYAMAQGGEIDYHPEFPRPYFRIKRRRAYVLQGILGNRTFRATFLPHAGPDDELGLIRLIEGAHREPGDGSIEKAEVQEA